MHLCIHIYIYRDTYRDLFRFICLDVGDASCVMSTMGSMFLRFPGVAAFVSPFLCEYLARRNSATFISFNQKAPHWHRRNDVLKPGFYDKFAWRYPPPEKKEQGKDSSRSQMCRRLWVEIDLCKQESTGNHLTLSKHFRKTGNCSLVPDWWQFLLAITTSGAPGAGRCCASDHGSPVLASVCDANRDGRACGNMWKWWVWGSEADGWKWNCFGGQICIFDF